MEILFLIRSLDVGGAQRQLVTLAKGLYQRGHAISVAVFYGGGGLEEELTRAGVPVHLLEKRGRWALWPFLGRLFQLIHREKPVVLHSYLTVANLFAIFVKPLFPGMRIVWGVRASNMDFTQYDWTARLTFRAECFFSRFADFIIVNSLAGWNYHGQFGFPGQKMVVIPNGIDTERFRPDKEARARLRQEWGIAAREKLIGIVGRIDPMKDHRTFLRAAALFAGAAGVRFVCVGDGPEAFQSQLHAFSEELGLSGKLIWTGARRDMPAVYNAMDIVTSSSSFGEGFPNVIAEAMACGVPCIVTDVGDAALLVGDSGIVVPSRCPEELVRGWQALLEIIKKNRGLLAEKVRAKVTGEFDLELLVERTGNIIKSLS